VFFRNKKGNYKLRSIAGKMTLQLRRSVETDQERYIFLIQVYLQIQHWNKLQFHVYI